MNKNKLLSGGGKNLTGEGSGVGGGGKWGRGGGKWGERGREVGGKGEGSGDWVPPVHLLLDNCLCFFCKKSILPTDSITFVNVRL